MTTNTKDIILKNQKHIMSYFRASDFGTKTNGQAFVEQVDVYYKDMHYRYPTPYHAIYQMVYDGFFLIYNNDIIRYLKSIGLKDEKKIENFKNHRGYGPMELYASLLARDGDKLYRAYTEGKNPLAPKKKAVAKKKTVKRK